MLNLIPHQLEDALRKEHDLSIARRASAIIFCVACVLTLSLYGGEWWLNTQQSKIDSFLYKPDQVELTKQVTGMNTRISAITSAQQEYTKWSALLGDVTLLVPEGVGLTYLSIIADTGTFDMRGKASTRDNLAEFKTLLEHTSIVDELNAPLSNFLEQDDIQFQFTGTINTLPYQKGSN